MSFKICYIWVSEFRNFQNFGVNLSSQEKFTFLHNKLLLNESKKIPDNFFGDGISDITGIIGKNGTGKSNLLELICKLVKGGKTSLNSDFFIITKQDNKFICYYSFEEPIKIDANFPISFINYNGDLDNLKVIYFSNVYDERTHIFDNKVSNLSANNRYTKHNWPNRSKTSNFVKQLQFIRSDLFESSEIPIPTKVIITPKINFFNSAYFERGINSNFSKNDFFSKELKTLWSDIKSTKPSKQKLYYSLLFSIVTDLLSEIRYSHFDDIFFDDLINKHTDNLINEIENIKLTYKSKFDIAKLWLKWTESIIIESFEGVFSSKLKLKELEKILDNIKILEKFEQFIDSKKLEINTEGARNRKTEDYILEFNQSASRLDEDFFNFIDTSNKFKLDWLGLSSGHKAYLDLFSLLRFEIKSIKADNILICIDEGDLYLHPKWQADFFYKLVKLIPMFNSANYQFVLTSHSPFLVSDLPRQNLIFLGVDSENHSIIIDNDESVKTFGGNIGELYIDAFFMEGGLISRFAANKIQKLIDKINNKIPLSKEDKLVIDSIGDEFINIHIENLRDGKN